MKIENCKLFVSSTCISQFAVCNFQFSMPFSSEAPTSVQRTFLRESLYWLAHALASLMLALVYLNPFIGDCDGLDYTIFSLHGRPSSMALGRSLFTSFNFGLYQAS